MESLQSLSKWNPFLIYSPDVKWEQNQNSFSWNGKDTGKGKWVTVKSQNSHSIFQNVFLTKPFPLRSKLTWNFKNISEGTEVTLSVQSTLPIYLRFLNQTAKSVIKSHYQLSLLKLHKLLNPDADTFELTFKGKKDRKSLTGIYENFSGSIVAMPQAIQKGFAKLNQQVQENQLKLDGFPFVAYKKFNPKKQITNLDIVIPVLNPPPAIKTQTYPSDTYFHIKYQGAYKYLDDAWILAISGLRMRKVRTYLGKKPSLDVYETDPSNTEPNHYITSIYIPVKSSR